MGNNLDIYEPRISSLLKIPETLSGSNFGYPNILKWKKNWKIASKLTKIRTKDKIKNNLLINFELFIKSKYTPLAKRKKRK